MFSPMVAIAAVNASPTDRLPTFAALSFSTSVPTRERDLCDHLDQALELLVARDEVGLRIDLDQRALAAFDARRRSGLRRRRGRPSWRPSTGPSCAASRPRPPCRPWSRSAPSCNPSCRRRSCSRSSLTSARGDLGHAVHSRSSAAQLRCAALMPAVPMRAWQADRPVADSWPASLLAERGDLREVEDADVVELLLERPG